MGKHLVILVGSVRADNYTMKAVRVMETYLHDVSYEIIDPATLSLPLPGRSDEGASQQMMQEAVKRATGVIIASPEYHGGISSVMKLMIDNLGFPSLLAGKPVALLGVAAGMIGAIKSLEMIRSICSHVGAIVLPGPISIAKINTAFDQHGKCDEEIERRIAKVPKILLDYIDQHICPSIALENMIREQQ